MQLFTQALNWILALLAKILHIIAQDLHDSEKCYHFQIFTKYHYCTNNFFLHVLSLKLKCPERVNKSGYLRKAAWLKCNKRLINKNKLLEDQKAVLTLLHSKYLAHACKCYRTRQDVPCKYCMCLACYVDLSIKNST